MSDQPASTPAPTATPAAPAAPLANPVLPAGIPFTQSAFERHRDTQPDGGTVPPTFSDEHAHKLEEARAADRRSQQAAAALAGRPPGQEGQPQAGQQPGQQGDEPLLKPKLKPAQVRRANDWETLKGDRDHWKAEYEKLQRGQPAGQQPSPSGEVDWGKVAFDKLANHPEVAKLKQERDTYYEEVKGVRVEADPEFKAKWDARTNAVMNTVKRVAGKAADEVTAILSDRDPDRRMAALAERIKDFGEGSKHQLIAAAAQLSAMEIERDIDVATRKATWEQTQSARKQQEQGQWSQKLAAMNNEFDHVWQEACHPESGIPFLMDDKVKAAVLPDARRVFTGESDPRSIAKASLQAALFPHVIKAAMQAWQEVERLQAANGQYASSWPGDEGGSQVPEPSGQAPVPGVNGWQYDGNFAKGIEAARQRDLAGKQWGQ